MIVFIIIGLLIGLSWFIFSVKNNPHNVPEYVKIFDVRCGKIVNHLEKCRSELYDDDSEEQFSVIMRYVKRLLVECADLTIKDVNTLRSLKLKKYLNDKMSEIETLYEMDENNVDEFYHKIEKFNALV